jgi:hypothetical protein
MRVAISKCWRLALASIFLSFFAIGSKNPAFAGSVSSTDTYAGDVNGLALPEGTFIFLNYNRYIHGDAFFNTPNALLPKLGNPRDLPANLEAYLGITRFVYFLSLWGHPLVVETAINYDAVQNANIGNMPVFNTNNQGLGPQPITNGLIDPVFFFTYGLIVEPKTERFLGLSNYFYTPLGTYDKFKPINFASPHQFTWVPQIEYAEGLEKFSPYLKGFWFDLIANASVHSDGDSTFAIANVGQFDKTTQDTSFNFKAYLSYYYTQGGYLAVGIEKSWGGDQIASGGLLGTRGTQPPFFGPTLFASDDYLTGHIEAVFAVTPDFHVSFDIAHDFEREFGFREDFVAEVRFTKFFIPQQQQPLK